MVEFREAIETHSASRRERRPLLRQADRSTTETVSQKAPSVSHENAESDPSPGESEEGRAARPEAEASRETAPIPEAAPTRGDAPTRESSDESGTGLQAAAETQAAAGAQAESKQRRTGAKTRRGKRSGGRSKKRPSRTPDSDHRASVPRTERTPPSRAYRALETWVRLKLTESVSQTDELPPHVEVRLTLPVRTRGKGRDQAEANFLRELEREVHRLGEQLDLDRLGYQSGQVFCHWCNSPVCEHSGAPDARSVFIGYEPTGKPRWREFTSWVVEQRDPRVDRLFQERPLPVAIYLAGDELTRDLLPDFHRENSPYRIVAQVAAGLFRIPAPLGELDRGIACTAQLIERRLNGGDPSYSLNLICELPHPHHLPTLLAERRARVLSQFVSSLREEVRNLETELHSARTHGRRPSLLRCRSLARKKLERAPGVLDKFLRRRERKTHHAEERARDPERPTGSARSDTLQAPATDLFYDGQQKTMIVRGPRNRVHVYREDGTHITSVVYPGETIRARIHARRWTPLDPDAARQLQERVAERGAKLDED